MGDRTAATTGPRSGPTGEGRGGGPAETATERAQAVNAEVETAEALASYAVTVRARLAHMEWFYSRRFFLLPGASLFLWLLPVGDGGSAIAWLGEDLSGGMGLVQESWLAFVYVGAVVLLLAHHPAWTQRLAPMGWVGRMALPNYLLQIVILDVPFTGYGLGLEIRER